jgi:hypothetical protein
MKRAEMISTISKKGILYFVLDETNFAYRESENDRCELNEKKDYFVFSRVSDVRRGGIGGIDPSAF